LWAATNTKRVQAGLLDTMTLGVFDKYTVETSWVWYFVQVNHRSTARVSTPCSETSITCIDPLLRFKVDRKHPRARNQPPDTRGAIHGALSESPAFLVRHPLLTEHAGICYGLYRFQDSTMFAYSMTSFTLSALRAPTGTILRTIVRFLENSGRVITYIVVLYANVAIVAVQHSSAFALRAQLTNRLRRSSCHTSSSASLWCCILSCYKAARWR